MALNFKEVANRITGISIWVFGLQWVPPVNEQDIIRKFIISLEDHSALYTPAHAQTDVTAATASVQRIRKECTDTLKELPSGTRAGDHIRIIRAACRQYVNRAIAEQWHTGEIGFYIALGELRSTIGLEAAILAAEYGVDIESGLEVILPEIKEEIG